MILFSYGSNMCVERLRDRVSSAEPLSIGYVNERRLVFHKQSNDGSGKADATETGSSKNRVWGVVFQIDDNQKSVLDKYEHLGVGYDLENVNVVTATGSVSAWMYVACPDKVNSILKPYDWYLRFLIVGAHQNQLPFCYILEMYRIGCLIDSDSARCALNSQIASSGYLGVKPNL